MSLADKVIEANEYEIVEKANNDSAPEGFYTDDLGFWVKQDIRSKKIEFANYVLFRCKYLNPRLNVRDAIRLFNNSSLVKNTQSDVASLADLPENIPSSISLWVYKKLLEDSPNLDRSKIEIKPGWVWDSERCVIIMDRKENNG